MTKQGITLSMEFLKRVDIKGAEVPAFNKVIAELQIELQKIEGPVEVAPPKKGKKDKKDKK